MPEFKIRLYHTIPETYLVCPRPGYTGLNPLSIATCATLAILCQDPHLLPYRHLTGDGIELAIYVALTMGEKLKDGVAFYVASVLGC